MTATAAFHLPTDDDDRAELLSVGIVLDAPEVGFPAAIADRDAAMSTILRQLGRAELDLQRFNAARAREHMVLDARYDRITDSVQKRTAWLTSLGRQLALETPMSGKAKTRHVAFGDYGTRKVPARVSVENAKELLAWAKAAAPDLVDQKIEERVLQKAAAEYFNTTGDLPPGCAYAPEHEDPVLKPDLSLLEVTS